jgi:hypothetical protein
VYRSHNRKRYRPGYSDRHSAQRPALDCQAIVNLSRRPILVWRIMVGSARRVMP